jgi:uncharacterized protein (DUF58 family)
MPRRLLPTRRGVAVAAVAVAAAAAGATFGPRSLDAVVVPAGVTLLAAGAQLLALDAPRVERRTPPPADPGTTATVRLAFDTDTPVTAVVRDHLPAGVDGDAEATALVGGDPLDYEVTYRERGEHTLGPATVSARDVLGLARRTFVVEGQETVLVYPRVYQPSPAVGERLRGLAAPDAGADRGAFDHLREYVRGDSLRDVHWKSSAKREELVVQEFADVGDRRVVTVAASAAAGRADAMAEATATVAVALLDEGASVSLATPDGRIRVAPGDAGRLLAHLARAGAGDTPSAATPDTDVAVHAADEVTIHIGGASWPFDPARRRPAGGTDDRDESLSAARPRSPSEVRA